MSADLHLTIECRRYRLWLPTLLIRLATLLRVPAHHTARLANLGLRHSGVRYRIGNGRWSRWPLSRFATVEVDKGEGIVVR